MNIGDYIKEKLAIWSVDLSMDRINAELTKINLSSSDEVRADTNLDLFFYNVIPDIMMQPSSISEGGYSVSFDKDVIRSYYNFLCGKLGKPNMLEQNNSIKDITSRWQ
jgi:hypothetical protein|uniref:Uncharacterized protein n=1 Tax=Siphoviridae sp. ctD4R19 TaxID=2823568 RepID=A0A8S5L634_9CAUD|nr:MAG TPA: hypothetical protein [Siphoviridae sp. ctD4R19]DAS00857.1 MAG TPA: hypothetical protein [Caudoviricetes sp.]